MPLLPDRTALISSYSCRPTSNKSFPDSGSKTQDIDRVNGWNCSVLKTMAQQSLYPIISSAIINFTGRSSEALHATALPIFTSLRKKGGFFRRIGDQAARLFSVLADVQTKRASSIKSCHHRWLKSSEKPGV